MGSGFEVSCVSWSAERQIMGVIGTGESLQSNGLAQAILDSLLFFR